jgi:hypothetical protein
VPRFDNTVVFAPQRTIQPDELRANFALPEASYPGAVLPRVVAEARDAAEPALVAPHLPVYTDDLAPVERLVDSIILGLLHGG